MEIYYTPRARNDLANIKESVIEKFDDENLAIEVLKKITKTVRQLVMCMPWAVLECWNKQIEELGNSIVR